MSIDATTEKQFELDIEAAFLSPAGGYVKGTDTYDAKSGLYVDTLIDFIRKTQPKAWARFENVNKVDTVKKFCAAFNSACDMSGLVSDNGAGRDGGKGNPPNSNGYPTAYLWEQVFQKDSIIDILQKFIHVEKNRLIFTRYHQLDVVRKMITHVSEHGAGHNYLIQHSAGSGKSNSIAWTAYRLASLHDKENNAIFASVIVVTDRTVLDAQLQATISNFFGRAIKFPLNTCNANFDLIYCAQLN